VVTRQSAEPAPGTLQGVTLALRLLRQAGLHDRLGVREAARLMSVTPTVAQRLLRTLESEGYLERDEDSRTYSLAPLVLELANSYVSRHDFASVSRSFLAALHDYSQETVAFYGLHDGMRICLMELPSPHALRMVARPGSVQAVSNGATDKVFRAYSDPALIQRMDDQMAAVGGGLTAPGPGELAEVRAQGWGSSFGARVAGSAALSAPVFSRDGLCVLSVFGPEARMRALGLEATGELLAATSRQLSEALAWFSDADPTR
jgi:DNA-binding IclR family transcriptional regulator